MNKSPSTSPPQSATTSKSLRSKDWINFAWLHCSSCSRVRVASCCKNGGLHCVPVIDDKFFGTTGQEVRDNSMSSKTNYLQCSDFHCEECVGRQKYLCADCSSSMQQQNVEIFRAQVEEINYLNQVWHKKLPNTIIHSMLYCSNCRAVGFPGSKQHLTVHGGSKGQELMHTNPSNHGKFGTPSHWRLVHTPQCLLNDIRLFTIKIDREEAIKFQDLVESRNALNVSEAALCAMELSCARHQRRQAKLQVSWNYYLNKLFKDGNIETTTTATKETKERDKKESSLSREETSKHLIHTFNDMRKLVVMDGYKVVNKMEFINIIRKVKESHDEGVYNWLVASCFGRLLREIIRSERRV